MSATAVSRKRALFLLLAPALLAACAGPARAGGKDYVWIEAESLAKRPAGFKVAGWGNKHYLSGDNWLFAAIDGKDAEALPAAGLDLRFPFALKSDGQHEVWARVGYEFVRAPFRWRIDEGAWGEDGPEHLTTDLMSLADWTEVAWIKLGSARLAPGKHTLQIHFARRVLPGKKQPERILAGLDCFCIAKGRFRPNGRHKPDENWQQAIDRQAAENVFVIPAAASGRPRTVLPLKGVWQIARLDEQEIKDRAEPVKELPADHGKLLFWKGAPVPGNRDSTRPDMLYCHRFLYRTRVRVPADFKGRSFVLRFPSTALIGSAFVNGKYVGGSTAPCTAWEADATAAVRPGKVNEVVVAIKDCYYALAQTGEGKSARYMFNFPTGWFYSGGGMGPTRFADFPVLLQVQGAGILEMPSLIVAGPTYTADVFAKPSVTRKELGLEITLRNPSAGPLKVQVENKVIPLKGGPAEKVFAPREVTLPAGGAETVTLAEKWENPKLWWPDDPQMYEVITRLRSGGKVVDERRTKFGFREWQWAGQHFTLNGVPWHFHADTTHGGKIEAKDRAKVVSYWKKSGINTVRYWGQVPWVGGSQEETLDFFDRIGMPIRRSGLFDGEAASYLLTESKNGKTVPRQAIFDHWVHYVRAWVKAERNHPSIFIWSVENEITFINLKNFGLLPVCEPEIRRGVQAAMQVDPTRPAMIDGGDALSDRSLPVYGNHYNEANFREYPDEARTMALAFGRHRKKDWGNPWPLGDDRPLFLGESFFANGYPPAAYAAVIGESAFLGRAQADAGVHLFARMLAEGYRWHGIAGFHFWFNGDSPDNVHYKAFQPVCVFAKEWNWTFAGGQKVGRTLKVFNDTRHADAITLSWSFAVGDRAEGAKETLTIPPGTAQELTIAFQTPKVSKRTAGRLTLTCSRGGKVVFQDVKPCFILAPEPGLPQLSADDITVYDPKGKVGPWLKQRGYPFHETASLDNLPPKLKVLLVGPDALTPRQATDPRWVALAAAGTRVLVLDQDNPLHYQAVPADLEPTPHAGRIAFPENLEHPAFAGLGKEDFFCWSGDHVVYRNAYRKAGRGARSLLQCDDELSCSALSECPVRDGILMLSQAAIGPKLDTDPVARRLLDNLIHYCLTYRPVAKTTVTVFPEGDLRLKLLDRIGLRHGRATDIVAALADPKAEVVVADAAAANLKKLAAAPDTVAAFTKRGGYLMLWGLTPEGLTDFNRLVGIHHVIRPFRLERVSLPGVRDPLLAGLTMRDVVLESTERIYPWSGDRYPAADTFTHVVDLDDIAPFAKSAGNAYGWSQMTNGLTSADSWKFIFYQELKNDPHPKWSAEFPHEEEVEEFSIILNTHYQVITKARLVFDGREDDAVTLDLRPVAELRQDFKISPPRKCQRITLEPVAFDTRGKQPTTGVDNIWIRVKRGPEYQKRVVPLLNIGALVKYRMGTGGIILNELRVPETEANPVNVEKKQALVAALLRNLGAAFAAERTLVAGYHMKYAPLPLDEKCTQYLTKDRGWLDVAGDLRLLPVGEQKLAGVNYFIRDFKTSPLPACIMLAGPGAKGALPKAVEGIPAGRKADMLFFLHTFHRVKEWRPSDKDKMPPAVFKYVVHYADGKALDVPVRYERGVGHWTAARPEGRPEAAVAWSAPLPEGAGGQAVVYQMSWVNPRPNVPIRSIDVRYDNQVGSGYGVPIVLAITAGTAGQ